MTVLLVDIVMVTYNHELFIAEAVESVLQQKCDFKYRIILVDDCSSDQTGQICQLYANQHPEKILLIQQPINVGLVLNYKTAFEACRAEFTAILEGDDYWTDDHKLQKQLDVIRSDKTTGLVHTGFVVRESNGTMRQAHLGIKRQLLEGNLYEEVVKDKIVFCPLTVVFRRNLLHYVDFDFCIRNNVWTIDAFLWPEFAKRSIIKYLPEVTGVYRRVSSAATSTADPQKLIWYYESGLAMKLYYLKKYPVRGMSQVQTEQQFLVNLLKKLIKSNAIGQARAYAVELMGNNLNSWFLKWSLRIPSLFRVYHVQDYLIHYLSKAKQKFIKAW